VSKSSTAICNHDSREGGNPHSGRLESSHNHLQEKEEEKDENDNDDSNKLKEHVAFRSHRLGSQNPLEVAKEIQDLF